MEKHNIIIILIGFLFISLGIAIEIQIPNIPPQYELLALFIGLSFIIGPVMIIINVLFNL